MPEDPSEPCAPRHNAKWLLLKSGGWVSCRTQEEVKALREEVRGLNDLVSQPAPLSTATGSVQGDMTEDELGRPMMSSNQVLPAVYPQLKDRENYITRKETGGLWQRNDADESAIQVRRRLQGSSSVDSGEVQYLVSTTPRSVFRLLRYSSLLKCDKDSEKAPASRPVV